MLPSGSPIPPIHSFRAVCQKMMMWISVLCERTVKLIFCQLGPHTWAENFAEAAGERQSPIDIQTNEASLDPDLSGTPLKWTWPDGTEDVTNTGYGWKAHVHGEGSSLTGGPLNEDVYQLEQFHAHWGKDGSCGSEHLVDGQSFAAEVNQKRSYILVEFFI